MTQPGATAEQPGAVQANAIEAGAVPQAVAQEDAAKAAAQEASAHDQDAQETAEGTAAANGAAVANGTDEAELVWYFGFGSMCNPVSLRRRGIHPTRSYPGRAAGWKLHFHLDNGMANIQPEEQAETHGVLHLITPAMMAALAKLEAIYDVEQVTVTPYHPGDCNKQLPPVTASAFFIPWERVPKVVDGKEHLPGDRYIRIITAGLSHFGVEQSWVDTIARSPSRPSCNPANYKRLPAVNPETLPVWSAQQLMAQHGKLPVVFAVGDRVMEVDSGDKELQSMAYGRIILSHFRGAEVAYLAIMALYEPNLPECTCPHDLREEHIAWAENEFMSTMLPLGLQLRQIATLAPGAALEVRQIQAAATAAHATGTPAGAAAHATGTATGAAAHATGTATGAAAHATGTAAGAAAHATGAATGAAAGPGAKEAAAAGAAKAAVAEVAAPVQASKEFIEVEATEID